jgi:tRNA (uracil-5-)-methyltransferase TRM9
MDSAIIQRLLDLNRQFYQSFAIQFSATRQRLQPGIRQILQDLPLQAKLLDLGCGNGELARSLLERGQSGMYIGLDFSAALLEIARQRFSSAGSLVSFQAQFFQSDLADPDWECLTGYGNYDFILAFAVLHHLPGAVLRKQLLSRLREHLAPGGSFIHSEWQFLNSPRLVARIQPWEAAGLNASDLDPGDVLLDWRQGGQGLRYVHAFDETELQGLAGETGFTIRSSFYSDGDGGRLGLYQIWQAA